MDVIFFSNIECDDTTTCIVEYLDSVPSMSVTIYEGLAIKKMLQFNRVSIIGESFSILFSISSKKHGQLERPIPRCMKAKHTIIIFNYVKSLLLILTYKNVNFIEFKLLVIISRPKILPFLCKVFISVKFRL